MSQVVSLIMINMGSKLCPFKLFRDIHRRIHGGFVQDRVSDSLSNFDSASGDCTHDLGERRFDD